MPAEAIPLTLISGFLGAGKTTWLNRLIRQGLPANSIILVNDFGRINIDADLIEAEEEQVLTLANGCACCSLGGTLADQLAEVLSWEKPPSAIYIEASGVAEPARIADIARVSPRLADAHIDCLVDAGQIERHREDRYTGEIWHAQIRSAHRLLINRLPADENLAAPLLAQLSELNPEASQQVETTSEPTPVSKRAISGGPMHSFTLNCTAPLSQQRLGSLFSEYSDVLLRAKGILAIEESDRAQVLQFSGSQLRCTPSLRKGKGGQLVCIGLKSERFAELEQRVRQLT
ncbi:CobW family GTP-binding protein [Marinobacterium mangrovicola]|uniref:G3E family GTPase n=1 Tax=Marinobacterium mangrovicola TaxID=1476959 RepID=A0A4R1GAP6_9GAMM|nr:CobW family GTP-binding protein [Marinobacterium mangrovicola]TCK03555.1 G3E family GTPase [Marinobacterium mangrovicola]